MKNLSILFLALSFLLPTDLVWSQSESITVTYERRVYWINIMSNMPWMTQEEIDRDKLSWGSYQGKYATEYDLFYQDGKSVYTAHQSDDNEGWSWRNDDYLIIRDVPNNESTDWMTVIGKNYVISGDMPKYKWKILNEIKEVEGYLCMKATTIDPIKEVTVIAWFTNELPVSAGPEGFSGLPGLILAIEYENEEATVLATNVVVSPDPIELPIPKKMKGKKISREEYEKMVKEFILKAYEREDNPYWNVRY